MGHRTFAVDAGCGRMLLVCECGVTLGRDRHPKTLEAATAHRGEWTQR